MTPDVLREFLTKQPFEPFEVRMANGDAHEIKHSENAAIGRNVFIVAYPDSDRTFWCTPHQIVSVEPLRSAETGNGET